MGGSDEKTDLGEFPIYVICMSPDASSNLERALDAIPEEKKEDLVFLQRGDMIEPTLKRRGLARERQTQAVLYLTERVRQDRGRPMQHWRGRHGPAEVRGRELRHRQVGRSSSR